MSNRRSAPPPPVPMRDSSIPAAQLAPQRVAPAPPCEADKQAGNRLSSDKEMNNFASKCSSCGFDLRDGSKVFEATATDSDKIRKMCVELVTKISQKTCLSDLRSVDLLEDVLERLVVGTNEPSGGRIHSVLEELHHCKNDFDKKSQNSTSELVISLFKKIEACKDDSQQRSWFLHEDEEIIANYLTDLIDILGCMDRKSAVAIVTMDHYSALNALVLYYQMEMRSSLRMLLLQLFVVLCRLDKAIISELLHSVLPLEIARDVQGNIPGDRFCASIKVLTWLFSTGENWPTHYYEYLNADFINFLIDRVESPAPDDDELVADHLVALVLSFNLHFVLPDENIVAKTVSTRSLITTFSQIVLLVLNRGDDPVHESPAEDEQHSILKFLSDIYSSPTTSAMFYTNDAKVLIDIIIRQLSDLPPASQLRREHLSLVQLMLRNSDYSEYRYRMAELSACCQRIYSEPDISSMDKRIIEEIGVDFPEILA